MKQINVLVLTVVAALLACPAWSAELAGYWSFDENQGTVAKTAAVKGYDGEIHGAKWVPGKVGSALEFNGDGDYVEVKDTAAGSPFALTSMSISAWINTKAYPAGAPVYWAGIAGKGYYKESTYGLRMESSGRLFLNVFGPFGEGGKTSSFLTGDSSRKSMPLNEWHHVVVTYDGESIKFYRDGNLVSSSKETRLPEINKQSIFIGSTSPKDRYFKGVIDEVKIYKGALTDAEVEAEYKKSGGTAQVISGNLPKTNEAPSLDGALSDLCWQRALKVDLADNNTGKAPRAATTGYICYDDKNIYIAFDCKEPLMDKVKAKVTEKGGPVWTDDCVEVFIDPELSRRNYYHFLLNSKNIQCDSKWDGASNEEKGWDGVWQSNTSLQPDGWTAKIKIPLSNFALAADAASSWGINLCRERKTEPENTSWSPTLGAFHSPEKFGTIREFNADFTPYKVAVSAPALSYSFLNNKPSLQLAQSFINSSKDVRQVNIKISNIAGSETVSKEILLAPGAAQQVTLPVSIKKDGNLYQFRTEITNAGDGAQTYCAYRTAECPALTQSYFDRSYYTNETAAYLTGNINIEGKLPDNLSIRVAIQAQGKTVSEKTVRVSGTRFNVPIALSKLTPEEYSADISLQQGRDALYTETLSLVKYSGFNNAVKVDKENQCMLSDDGMPFFPIGITRIPDQSIDEYAQAGFNITQVYGGTNCTGDIAYYNGMKVLAGTYWNIPRDHYKTLPADLLETEIRNSLSPTVKLWKDHPSFAGYFWDEPSPEEVKGAGVLSKVTRELDPYHPIMPCFYQRTGPTIPAELYDLYIADLYWVNAPSSKKCILHTFIASCAKAAEKMHKPFWYMPNAAGWEAQSAVTPQEQRAQTYLGLIYGAKGIFYWIYNITYPSMRVELMKLAGELRELSPVLLTRSPEQTVTGADAAEVHALAKIYSGDCYLLTANNSADEEKTVRIRISSAGVAKSAKVLFENRIVPVKGGVLEDKFAPYATHVYVLQKADAKKPVQIAIEKAASSNVPLPKIRRWPDCPDTLDGVIGNPGFEEEEDGQPRLWTCAWEMPEYCSLDSKMFQEGSRSLKLSMPRATRYTSETGFGWSAESAVTAFDLGKLRQKCRYGHTVKNGLFKVDLPNGKYSVTVLSGTSELFEMKRNARQPLTMKTVGIPVVKGIKHAIKENTFDVTVEDGQFSLSIPSGAIYSLTITPKSGRNTQVFDFGPGRTPVSTGHKIVSAPELASIFANSGTGDFAPKIKLKDGVTYKLSVYMKSDTPDTPVTFGMIRQGTPWGPKENKTVKVGGEWARYEVPIKQKGEWAYVELNAPGTVWVDNFSLEKN